MRHSKSKLLSIARKIENNKKVTPQEISTVISFEKAEKELRALTIAKKAAVPIALAGGFLIAVYPKQTTEIVKHLPAWTNLPEQMVIGADYIWNLIGEPVGKSNVLYHIPNIVLYAFGILGVKKLFDAIDRRTWVDKVNAAKKTLLQMIDNGNANIELKNGHSALFVGGGDFIGTQFVLNHKEDEVVIVGTSKPNFTNIWNYYDQESSYEQLKTVLERVCSKKTGEYMFFPVKDDQIFLPSSTAFDLSPHKLDILCQDIRTIEKQNNWGTKRIIIVGDKFHNSYVQSEDQNGKVKNSEDKISIETIAGKYPNVTLLDPTDIVLKHVLAIAKGRKIVFRATKEGIAEYKKRFYDRLGKLGYKDKKATRGVLTIGYDLLEDQTEQQTLSKKINDYYPVVLSVAVRDALLRNGYKKDEFIYVPDLVLEALDKKAREQ